MLILINIAICNNLQNHITVICEDRGCNEYESGDYLVIRTKDNPVQYVVLNTTDVAHLINNATMIKTQTCNKVFIINNKVKCYGTQTSKNIIVTNHIPSEWTKNTTLEEIVVAKHDMKINNGWYYSVSVSGDKINITNDEVPEIKLSTPVLSRTELCCVSEVQTRGVTIRTFTPIESKRAAVLACINRKCFLSFEIASIKLNFSRDPEIRYEEKRTTRARSLKDCKIEMKEITEECNIKSTAVNKECLHEIELKKHECIKNTKYECSQNIYGNDAYEYKLSLKETQVECQSKEEKQIWKCKHLIKINTQSCDIEKSRLHDICKINSIDIDCEKVATDRYQECLKENLVFADKCKEETILIKTECERKISQPKLNIQKYEECISKKIDKCNQTKNDCSTKSNLVNKNCLEDNNGYQCPTSYFKKISDTTMALMKDKTKSTFLNIYEEILNEVTPLINPNQKLELVLKNIKIGINNKNFTHDLEILVRTEDTSETCVPKTILFKTKSQWVEFTTYCVDVYIRLNKKYMLLETFQQKPPLLVSSRKPHDKLKLALLNSYSLFDPECLLNVDCTILHNNKAFKIFQIDSNISIHIFSMEGKKIEEHTYSKETEMYIENVGVVPQEFNTNKNKFQYLNVCYKISDTECDISIYDKEVCMYYPPTVDTAVSGLIYDFRKKKYKYCEIDKTEEIVVSYSQGIKPTKTAHPNIIVFRREEEIDMIESRHLGNNYEVIIMNSYCNMMKHCQIKYKSHIIKMSVKDNKYKINGHIMEKGEYILLYKEHDIVKITEADIEYISL